MAMASFTWSRPCGSRTCSRFLMTVCALEVAASHMLTNGLLLTQPNPALHQTDAGVVVSVGE